ncbi:MAG: SH3 domain-containing protein [Aggregatilineales bacterium]
MFGPLGGAAHSRRTALAAFALVVSIAVSTTLACNAGFSAQLPAVTTPRPAVIFLAPDANSQIADGATVQIAVDVLDELGAGVVRVDFAVDGVMLGSQRAQNPAGQREFTALQIWTASGVQGHLIDATAYRLDNTVVGDALLTVTVAPLRLTPTSTLTLTITPTLPPPSDLPTFTPSVTIITLAALAPPGTLTPTAPSTVATANPATQSPAPTINGPQVSIQSATLNVRGGPGIAYALVGVLKLGDTVAIVGRNADRSWWVIQSGPLRGWIINSPAYMTVSGDTSAVPLVAAPPSPVPEAISPTALPPLIPTSTHAP